MDSFICWIGGKKLLRKKIVEQFPEQGTFKRYIEVFGGAGWILFFSNRHAQTEVYNDINGELVNLFRCTKYHPEALQQELRLNLTSREQFLDAREQIGIRGLTDIQRAARFFLLIKESFGANLSDFGLRPKNINKAIDYLSMVSQRLNSVVIENADFERILKIYDKEDALFYLDPPYYGAEQYYTISFTEKDHLRLKEALSRIKGKFVLSYNDCDDIRELYKEDTIIEIDRAHNLVCTEKKPRYKEIIIKNFP